MIQQATIYITKTDRERLGNLIELVRNEDDRANLSYVSRLEDELEDAEVVASEDIPPDVVTMRSKVRLKDLDTNEENVYSIVFPAEANSGEGKISILAPLATALLGYKRGDTVEFQAPSRLRRLQILEILYQLESAGDYIVILPMYQKASPSAFFAWFYARRATRLRLPILLSK